MPKKFIHNLIFYILATLLVSFLVLEIVFPEQAIHILGFRNYAVVSDSMEPDLSVNDVVVVRKTKLENLAPGDMVTFYTYLPTIHQDDFGNTIFLRSVVTHYLGAVETDQEGRYYLTYGIKNNPNHNIDNWKDEAGQPTVLRDEDIIGVVAFKIPWIGTISMFLRVIFTSPMMLFLIALNIAIVVVLIKVIKKKPKDSPHGME